jgi:hypothetical protein
MNKALTILACVSVAGMAAVPACVTESITPTTRRYTGAPVKPGAATTSSSSKMGQKLTPAPGPPALPDGPVAVPATTSKTTSSEVQVGVVPLGVVLYDGQALPLVSPDGRFIVVEEGDPPTWEAILAEPAAAAPPGAALAVYEVGEHELKRVAPAQALPTGLILGRAADDHGFLVEAPQADGSRWIGRVAWATQAVEWLVQGPLVCSHAILTARGELVYTSRAVESDSSDLVIRGKHGDQTVRTPGDGRYAFPMCTQDPDMVYAFHLTPATMEVEAIRLDRGSMGVEGERGPRFGAAVARRGIAPKGDLTAAFQIASTVQPVLPLEKGVPGAVDAPLTLWHPRLGRMSCFKLDSASFDPLASKSFAAIASQEAERPGYFCATDKGLVFQPPLKTATDDTAVRVVSGAYMPRQLRGTPQTMLLFGQNGRPDQYEIVKLIVGPGAGPAKEPKG